MSDTPLFNAVIAEEEAKDKTCFACGKLSDDCEEPCYWHLWDDDNSCFHCDAHLETKCAREEWTYNKAEEESAL